LRTGELVITALEPKQLLALGERRQRACVKRANQGSFEKTEHNRLCAGTHTYIVETHATVDSRTAELVVAAKELRQRDARCERRQRACVTRANPVSFKQTEHNGGYVGYDTSIR
jgi:hypothetical protein